MQSTLSLTLLPCPLWPGVVAPDKVLSMDQIEQAMCKKMIDDKLWLLYFITWNYLWAKKSPGSFENVIDKASV